MFGKSDHNKRMCAGVPAQGGSPLLEDLDHMPAELGAADADLAGFSFESCVLEGFDHLTASESSEVPAVLPGGA